MDDQRQTYTIQVAGVTRDLPLFEVAPGVKIAIVNILGDNELVQASANALALRLQERNPEVLVTAEAKSIPLAYAMSVVISIPYVVLRKAYKAYMGKSIQAKTHSITTGAAQSLFMHEKDQKLN